MMVQNLTQNSLAVKECEPPEGYSEKDVKSKVAAKKWLWWWVNGYNFNNDNSGEFGAKS